MRIRVGRPSHTTLVAYLALFVAMSGTAAAATGGVFVLGQRNQESRPSTVVNSGDGAALRLKTESGQPPLAVNRRAKVANLNADLLDGRSASAFLPVDGTAENALNALNAAKAASASDAGTLDGHDSTYFQKKVKPIVVVQWAEADTVTVTCPTGQVAVGGGFILAANSGDPATRDSVYHSAPRVTLSDPIGWELKVHTPGGVDGAHAVYAVCVE